MQTIPERDWMVFKSLYDRAVERFLDRSMKEVEALVGSGKPAQKRFLEIQAKMREQAKDCDTIFNGFSRSRASMQILIFRRWELITDEEVQMFSEETQGWIERCFKGL